VREGKVFSSQFSVFSSTLADLAGDDPATNAAIARAVLAGKDRGPKRDIVLLNAAAALVVTGKACDFDAGCALAAELIDSGAALARLEQFVAASNRWKA